MSGACSDDETVSPCSTGHAKTLICLLHWSCIRYLECDLLQKSSSSCLDVCLAPLTPRAFWQRNHGRPDSGSQASQGPYVSYSWATLLSSKRHRTPSNLGGVRHNQARLVVKYPILLQRTSSLWRLDTRMTDEALIQTLFQRADLPPLTPQGLWRPELKTQIDKCPYDLSLKACRYPAPSRCAGCRSDQFRSGSAVLRYGRSLILAHFPNLHSFTSSERRPGWMP